MLVLGVDPGTATTGYGLVRVLENGDLQSVTYGVISTPKNTNPEERLLSIYSEILELISLHSPDTAAVEKLFFSRNVTTALAVGQARGVVLLALAQCKVHLSEYTPMEIKQAIAGYGGADKSQVQMMVKAILNLDDIPRPDDAADALAVAICHSTSYRYRILEGR
ncbi:MAG: crossover junction endodeoxyribonuclease RuvC [Chloroflexi bacterium]|mgnify:CR=1 FL=1|jgi:crossover junction endodeoxyribonuclease RuvC|nr:crossover junction endodeoxyribonuclease RuvC [Chloroflexota bacterium]BCY18366.1 crossover junction endodeoxyribonuclease RuvC [Leptolinea sp. HRD-7]